MDPIIVAAMIGAGGVVLGGVLTLGGAHLADRRAVLRERERIAADREREADGRLFEHRRQTVAEFLGMYEKYSSVAFEVEYGITGGGEPPEDYLSPMWTMLGMIDLYFPRAVSEAASDLYYVLAGWLYRQDKAPPEGYGNAASVKRDKFLALTRGALGVSEAGEPTP